MSIDVRALISNIYFIAKEKGIKIGELESKAGTTPGYLSRFLKNDVKSIPNLDIIAEIANILDMPIDNLIFDLAFYSKNISFWINTIQRIIKETREGSIDWDFQNADIIKRMMKTDEYGRVYSNHPLFEAREYNGEYYMCYYSRFTGESTMNYYDIYTFDKGDNTYYLSKFVSGDSNDVVNFELYCEKYDGKLVKVCNSYEKKPFDELQKTMEVLYETCYFSSRFPKITEDAKEALNDLFKK